MVQLVTADDAALAKSGAQPQPFIPEAFALYPNFPNPFNPLTHIQFDLPQDAPVTLEVYNIKGQKIRTLLDGQRPAGRHEVVFNAAGLSSGIYVYRLKAGSYQAIKRMVLVK